MTGADTSLGGTFALGRWRVRRAGYGAMQLSGDGVFGPPRDRDEALRVALVMKRPDLGSRPMSTDTATRPLE